MHGEPKQGEPRQVGSAHPGAKFPTHDCNALLQLPICGVALEMTHPQIPCFLEG